MNDLLNLIKNQTVPCLCCSFFSQDQSNKIFVVDQAAGLHRQRHWSRSSVLVLYLMPDFCVKIWAMHRFAHCSGPEAYYLVTTGHSLIMPRVATRYGTIGRIVR